jgi:hypothetical protein
VEANTFGINYTGLICFESLRTNGKSGAKSLGDFPFVLGRVETFPGFSAESKSRSEKFYTKGEYLWPSQKKSKRNQEP